MIHLCFSVGLTSLSMIISRPIHVAAKGIISFLLRLSSVFHCICLPHLAYPFLCWWTFRLLPCSGYYNTAMNTGVFPCEPCFSEDIKDVLLGRSSLWAAEDRWPRGALGDTVSMTVSCTIWGGRSWCLPPPALSGQWLQEACRHATPTASPTCKDKALGSDACSRLLGQGVEWCVTAEMGRTTGASATRGVYQVSQGTDAWNRKHLKN